MILPTSRLLLSQSSQPNQTPSPCKKIATALSIGLGLSLSGLAQAQLPAPVESALNRAHISTDDISLIIQPVTPNSRQRQAQSASSTDNNAAETSGINSDASSIDTDTESAITATTAALPNSNLPAIVIPKPEEPSQDAISVDTTDALPPEDQDSQEHDKAQPISANDSEVISPLTTSIRHLADIPRTPASTMKLIPTFIALDLLGPDFTWFTKVYYTGYLSANTLHGDLIIQGSGDPKLTHRRLAMLLSQVRQAGIRHIEGDIVLDSSAFRGVGKDPAAFDNDPLRPYNASPDGLLINFNSIEMTTIPLQNSTQQGLANVFYKPKLADYHLPTTIPVGSSGRCSSVRYSLSPSWQNDRLSIAKPLPTACGAHTFYIAYPNVKDFAQRVVKEKWLNLGNTMSGNIKFLGLGNTLSGDTINTEYPLKTRFGSYLDMSRTGDKNALLAGSLSTMPSSPLPLVTYPSLPLSQQIYDINHYSNNVMTEQVTLSLPLFAKLDGSSTKPSQSGPERYSDYNKALGLIDHWWQKNLKTPAPVMSNGSGLCRDCSVTADNLAELLSYAYNHPNFDTYVNSLGIAGVSGTISEHADRLPNSEAIGRAWIKTGTLNNVTSMAGYVHGHSGQDYVVVGIINGSSALNTYDARAVLDTMLDWTAQH